jgi:hypothetical protein
MPARLSPLVPPLEVPLEPLLDPLLDPVLAPPPDASGALEFPAGEQATDSSTQTPPTHRVRPIARHSSPIAKDN